MPYTEANSTIYTSTYIMSMSQVDMHLYQLPQSPVYLIQI